MGNQHVVPHADRWAVQDAGSGLTRSTHATQERAVQAARRNARAAGRCLYIHGRDGAIRSRESFGSRPFPPIG